MARSAEHRRRRLTVRGLAVAGVALVTVALAGCTSTQNEAQRLQLDAARLRSAIAGTRVETQNPKVRPISVKMVSAAASTAFVVTVHNTAGKAVTDLPISVGYAIPGGSDVYLNAGTDLKYFQSHLPAIAAGKSLTWVYTSSRKVPRGARLFALVGDKPAVSARLTDSGVRIGLHYGYTDGSRTVTIHLDNPTSVPQYQLQLYAYAPDGGGYTAAGNTTVDDLGAGSKQKITLALVGTGGGRGLKVRAIPTVLQ